MIIGQPKRDIIMASMTLAEAQAQLTQVNIAIETLLQGKRIGELKIGTNEFSRTYKYGEVTLEGLRALRSELMAMVNTLMPTITTTFRQNACIPLIVTKEAY